MAATVVSVVIFLCGVLVGRGVRTERPGGDAPIVAGSPTPDAITGAQAPQTPAPDPRTASAPPPDVPEEPPSYVERLESKAPVAEELKAVPDKPVQKATTGSAPRETARPAPPPATASAPADGGYALQVAALRERVEAEAIAKRLSSKGYSAYVMSPASGTPAVYRVRVGQFKTRRDAETAAARLQKEEQFKPWITR